MQFKGFDWLSGHGIWAIIPCPTNMVSVRVILGRFRFYFSLLFYILGAFLIKQLLRSTKWNANLILLRDFADLVVLCKV